MDIEDGGRFIIKININFYLREIGDSKIYLAVFKVEALKFIREIISPRSL